MKYIVKSSEPKESFDWKKSDKMFLRGNPKWKKFPTHLKDILRDAICKEQGYICCYCERNLLPNDYHLEHLLPKAPNKFPLKQLDYDNLLCSCQLELEEGEPRHCGNSKGSWFDDNLFISPLNPDCETKFKYTFDGYIEPANEDDNAAITTIKKLNLDIDKLNALRRGAVAPFVDEEISPEDLNDFVSEYLKDKNENDGKFNEFFTTIRYLFVS